MRSAGRCEAAGPVLLALLLMLLIPGSSATKTGVGPVTCGSVLKLLNTQHRVRLHSHDIKYGSGSGQQSVTGVEASGDANSYWRIRGGPEGGCPRGSPVRCGQAVRLTHVLTGKNLHTHHFLSPLSNNQHVGTSVFLSVTGEQYGSPIRGQHEVHGMLSANTHNTWKAMEGIFIKPGMEPAAGHDEL
ncbi:stromal cell-derived factor 2-like protein 1 isoform X2 [Fukomys damarensis]|uniref:stromal cell-derived factor 2-like protein 1 isoform X2 n=1 Tax=Fukomys damarensis TaxID=885580 RepID=UPI000540106B|nr:stromal cell-derived factor 2-like protein 1 isoform X2 [Fukomys damarensis]